jgi:DNA-binding transcriptional regulator YiaG
MGLWRFAPAALRDVAVLRGTTVAPQRGMPDSTRSLVRTLRQQLGMTQEEFAHEIAVTVSTVNRWENAHAEPSKLAWKAIRDLARQRGLPSAGTTTSATY